MHTHGSKITLCRAHAAFTARSQPSGASSEHHLQQKHDATPKGHAVRGHSYQGSWAHEPSFVTSYLVVNPPPLQGSLSAAVEVIRPLSVALTKSRHFSKGSYPATSYSSNLLCWCSSGVECRSASAKVLMPAGYDHSFRLLAFQSIEYWVL